MNPAVLKVVGFVAFCWCAALGSDLTAQSTSRVSVSAAGAQSTGNSEDPDLSHTGRFVAFISQSPGLVPEDVTTKEDIFVVDRHLGTIERVSVSTAGVEANQDSRDPSISADGRVVAFLSFAGNLDPLDPGIASDIYVRDRVTGTTELVSQTTAGVHPSTGSSLRPVLSADGRYVVFDSSAKLDVADTSAFEDVFIRDLAFNATTRVNLRPDGSNSNPGGIRAGVSGDGRFVCYDSADSQLVAGDTNLKRDVFVRDMLSGLLGSIRVSLATDGTQGNGDSDESALSDDGSAVTFVSSATNLVAGDTNAVRDVFVRDLITHTTTRVSVATGGGQANGNSLDPELSADGRYVVFRSEASNLVANDTNGDQDTFLHDRVTGQTTLLSQSTAGLQSDENSGWPAISGDGRYAAFDSIGTNLVAGDTNGKRDIFLRNFGACSGAGLVSAYGTGLAGDGGFTPALWAEGCPQLGEALTVTVEDGRGGAAGVMFLGLSSASLPFKGGQLYVGNLLLLPAFTLGGAVGVPGAGSLSLPFTVPTNPVISGVSLFFQFGFADSAAPVGVSLTRGLEIAVG